MSGPNLNFHRAEYGDPVDLSHCTWCGRGLGEEWFHANEQPICAVCAANAQEVVPKSSGRRFWRSVAWGCAAALGLALALTFVGHLLLVLHFGFGYVLIAIPVGLYIGRAMRHGSGGVGGRKYQFAAALLTYIAVSIGFLSALVWGTGAIPLSLFVYMAMLPILEGFSGHAAGAGITLLAAMVGIRWAWMALGPHPLKITGPFQR